jgi:hypothetical protein
MSRTIWFLASVSLLASGTGSLVANDPQVPGPVRPAPLEPREGSLNNDFGGTVTKVTKDSITLQSINRPEEEPRTFALSETLAAGKVPIERRLPPGQVRGNPMMPEYMYRLTDVKVGDCIGIFYARINGVDICDHIRIARRPDGLVPPLPEEAENLRRGQPNPALQKLIPEAKRRPYVPYHEWQNAYWEKIAPMPRELKPRVPLDGN